MDESAPTRFDGLGIAATAFLAANLLHTADHVRQHMAGVNVEIMIGGGMLTVAAVLVAIVALRRYRRAALLAAIVGFTAAALVSASHLAPHWSVISDSYLDDIHPDVLSWAVMLLEVGTGVVLGVVGLYRLRIPGREFHSPDASTDRSAESTATRTTRS
jgi:hypothetical protein